MSNFFLVIKYLLEFFYDFYQSIRYNSYSPFESKELRIYYRLIIATHTIEKGLSLSEMKPLFGKSKFKHLRQLVGEYDYTFSSFPLQKLIGALNDYIFKHQKMKIEDPFLSELESWRDALKLKVTDCPNGGYKRSEDIVIQSETKRKEAISFLGSRFSFRNFNNQSIDSHLIHNIVELAQNAPSQCNRQSSKVHCYQNKETIKLLLGLQGGSVGFSHRVSNLFIISSESTAWGGLGQRNQTYVDGALFSQMLMLSLQAFGLVCCPLNLAVPNKKENQIKKMAGIHQRERLIMMIAFGKYNQNELKAARSPRVQVNSILINHN